MPRKIEISHRTIIFTLFALLALWFLYFIRDIILEFFVALLIMTVLNPLVGTFSRVRIPRMLSVVMAYLIVLGVFGGALFAVLPPLIDQSTNFATSLPGYINTFEKSGLLNEQVSGQFLSQVGSLPGQVLRIGFSALSNFLGIISVLIFSFYLLVYRDKLDGQLGFFFGEDRRREIAKILDQLEKRLGGWARGELALMALVGTANYVGLSLLGVPFALPLAILAGILEIIPYLGPILAAILVVVIGFSISPFTGFAALALAFLVQQTENYVFVPKVMEKSVGVNPIITLLALTIGFRLAGVLGAVISVPVVITISVLSENYLFSKT